MSLILPNVIGVSLRVISLSWSLQLSCEIRKNSKY